MANRSVPLILLVEDSLADALLVREVLRANHVDADLVLITDGEAAIAYVDGLELSTEPMPALIILDLNLPRRSGHEVLVAVRRGRCRKAYAVILSCSDAANDRATSAKLGADRHMRKPSDLQEFMEIGRFFAEILTRREA